MKIERVQDMVARGIGRAATVLGAWCDAFRPSGAQRPLDPARRYLRLQAAFMPDDGGMRRPVGYGRASWIGLFDSAYTRVGDYIERKGPNGGVWFVAAQQPMLPVLCVRANQVVSLQRPAAADRPGVNRYGGVDRDSATTLLSGWPASVLAAHGGGLEAGLPGDASDGSWHVLLPVLPIALALRPGDLMRDDLGRAGVVASAELSDLGWKLLVRQAAS